MRHPLNPVIHAVFDAGAGNDEWLDSLRAARRTVGCCLPGIRGVGSPGPQRRYTVSRRHARLIYRDARCVLQDLASTNGTFVNGVRVGRCELRVGDHLRLGEQELLID